ncbi:hypothetical protein DBB29_06845 [Pandoraea cepalis]|uniref:Transposase n=1 Tax=Pandoraea cepalis TaxID=2508294 RepID=A0AAW7MK89_9BURK|nr:hypothetical protein [Pandoraea cepalis]MDN4577831.1 hypothetical protein [Pandoraea cepalis]
MNWIELDRTGSNRIELASRCAKTNVRGHGLTRFARAIAARRTILRRPGHIIIDDSGMAAPCPSLGPS